LVGEEITDCSDGLISFFLKSALWFLSMVAFGIVALSTVRSL